MTATLVADIERWRETIAETFVEFEIDSAGDEFHGGVDRVELGRGVAVTQVATDRSHVVRTPALARDGRDDVLFLMQRTGCCTVASGGGRGTLTPGGATLQPRRRALFAHVHRGVDGARARAPSPRAGGRSHPSRTVDGADRREQPCAADAHDARRQGAALDSGVREELGQNAVELLRSATRPVEREVAQTSGHTIFLAVRRAMLLHARDPDFTIADAAALAHVSLRYAQKLFEREGVRMSTFLRTRRLQEAAALLESGTQARSVEAVAHLAGFADVNTFIRAFAREYGTTPAKWRRERQG
jgi:AraC-like DNA-binding protein